MSGYTPGTVGVATVRGVKDVRVMRLPTGSSWALDRTVDGGEPGTFRDTAADIEVTDVRPLVVLDLGDWTPESVAAIPAWLRDRCYDSPTESCLRRIATQIEVQTRPPKPPEPTGLGAVVKDRQGHVWVRIHESYGDLLWRMDVPSTCAEPYDRIDAVEVLSEGVVQP